MSKVDANGPLPGVNRVFTFPEWRFTPTQDTLMFNFKTEVLTEEEAIDIIAKEYGMKTIAAARQLRYPAVLANNWMILETLFKSSATRKQALIYGVTYRKRVYMPFTTSSRVLSCTAISFFGMPVQPEKDALSFAATKAQSIWSTGTIGELDNLENFVSGRAAIKVSQNPSGSISTTRGFKRGDYGASIDSSNINSNNSGVHRLDRPKNSQIWLQRTYQGVFTGNATVVVDGFDEWMAEKKNGSLAYYVAAPEYPLLEIYVRRCQMYCTKCQTLNHHQTDDCTDVAVDDLHDPNDDSVLYDKEDDDYLEEAVKYEKGFLEDEDSDLDPSYTFVESSSSETDSDDNDNGMDSDTCPRGKSV